MIKAILFDLDDTLLGNDIDTFLPRYFKLLGQYARPFLDQQRLMQALLLGTDATTKNIDPTLTNREVFWSIFQDSTGMDAAEMELNFDAFYRNEFEQLQNVVTCKPVAADLVRRCIDLGLQVVIATNPLFPRRAIEARLRWAGVPVTEFDYALVTTYENMHATKPQPLYYKEILQKINGSPETTLMVGDSWDNDIEPAAGLGLFTYWIELPGKTPTTSTIPTGSGSLGRLYKQIQAGWLIQPPI